MATSDPILKILCNESGGVGGPLAWLFPDLAESRTRAGWIPFWMGLTGSAIAHAIFGRKFTPTKREIAYYHQQDGAVDAA